MRLLVCGGAGYVGSHVTRALLRAGHEAWVYDDLSKGHAAAVPEGRLVTGSLSETAKLADLFRWMRIDGVLHFAARTLVGESVTDPAIYYQNNVTATLSLLDAVREAKVPRLVFSSTTAVYGDPARVPIDESQPIAPINPYGYTKAVIEQALADYAHAYGLGYAALRYFNAAGASPDGDLGEDHSPESHLIPLVLQVALGQRPYISVFGRDYPTPDGTCVRDYVHVEDLASAHLAALERIQSGRGIICNLGTGVGYSVRQVIDACRRVTGHAIPEVAADRRAGDAPELIADASLAGRLLDWTPRYTSLDEIVATAWKWHSTHPNGYGAPRPTTPAARPLAPPLATQHLDAGWGQLSSF